MSVTGLGKRFQIIHTDVGRITFGSYKKLGDVDVNSAKQFYIDIEYDVRCLEGTVYSA